MERREFIKENIIKILDNINEACKKVGRQPDEVKLMAVSKNMPADDILIAIENGVKIIGENIVQEAKGKYEKLSTIFKERKIEFHFIGHLQSNKAKLAAEIFDFIDTIDRNKIIDKLEENCKKNNKILECMIQVNLSEEATKYGLKEQEVKDLLIKLKKAEHLKLKGLFLIAPFFEEPEQARFYFRKLYLLREELQKEFSDLDLSELCMGMTNDYKIAIEEGATLIRIGRAIFGERVSK